MGLRDHESETIKASTDKLNVFASDCSTLMDGFLLLDIVDDSPIGDTQPVTIPILQPGNIRMGRKRIVSN
jgi:hypothetical protein